MPAKTDFPLVFSRLRRIFGDIPGAVITINTNDSYSLNTPYAEKFERELFLGAVQVKKNYVSFYLMPVYMYPDLLVGLSPELKKRMQGKSCFNFKAVDEGLFAELEALTAKSLRRMRLEGFLPAPQPH
jgi:hypothetical protein